MHMIGCASNSNGWGMVFGANSYQIGMHFFPVLIVFKPGIAIFG